MPTAFDLMGFGTPPALAGELGNSPQAVTGTGTSQTTAAPIYEHLASVTASGGNTGAILPSGAKIGTPYYVCSVSGTAALIYPPVGHTLNGTLNQAVTMSAATTAGIFIQFSSKNWFTIPLAP